MENKIEITEPYTPGPWGVDIDNENLDRIEVVYRGGGFISNAHLIAAITKAECGARP